MAGPLELTPGRTAFLGRFRGAARPAAHGVPGAVLEPLDVLGSDGSCRLVETDGELPELPARTRASVRPLRSRPLGQPAPLPPGLTLPPAPAGISPDRGAAPSWPTTLFPPEIDALVAQADPPSSLAWIENLAGANPVTVLGNPHTFTTRYTRDVQCDLAEQYVDAQFQNLGFSDVAFDPYSFGGTDARNVIATLPGSETPEQIVILGGHLDSTSPDSYNLAPGANDNASGMAAVLATAAILGGHSFRSTLRFIAFTGEEQGMRGSEHYASQAAANGDQIIGVINCDMIAWYDQLYGIDIEGEPPRDWLMQIMNDACGTYTTLATHLVYNSRGSDHVPFQNEGFAAFLAIETEYDAYPCYHQTCDTAGWNDPLFGADVTRACLAAAAYLAEPVAGTGVAAAAAGAPLASGVYLLRLRAGDVQVDPKAVLVR